ncbi:MAG: methyltransferase [Actinophytocola sp.]|uniref:class I SAM-dependent methyltransferase n=1 Tax=Actinophytocola sp. TaxID=1872138 RepID=UPI0013267181|nr:class I SAM-dependent methyltransferase [Actinophytocola sp.]MPZ81288.1 methyltransferase [Actinophytocola sp.]
MRIQVALNDELQDYIADVSLREPDLLRELRAETAKLPWHLMQVPPEQGQFLSTLVKAVRAKRVLEVGVFTGYSLLSTALALPAGGAVVALEINPEWSAIALDYCKRAGVADMVDLRVGDATRSLAALVAEDGAVGSFDFVFIDANKEGYQTYYEAALTLLRPGGLIVIDNVLWHGTVVNPSAPAIETRVLREFNERLRHDERVDFSLLPVADGMTLAVKR